MSEGRRNGKAAEPPPGRPALTHLIYLHGFRSSPQSTKARLTLAWLARHRPDITVWCPQLPPSPDAALRGVLARAEAWPAEQLAVVGSSLGGFYATAVAERTGCHAALLNPAVNPARDLAAFVGENHAWHSDETLFFEPAFVDELRDWTPAALTRPERYLAVIAKGDEVLDWREMLARYAHCRLRLLEGGDHALSDYAEHLPAVMQFLGATPPAG